MANSTSSAAGLLMPLVICGPSGAGKGTIIAKLMEKYPDYFGFSVSNTSRGPRPGEQDGVHYYFSSIEEIDRGIAAGEYIEYANVHTNKYGTTFKAVESVQAQGKVCILDIDIQGCQSVKKSALQCRYLFINPPSIEELEKRLKGRGTETEDKVKVRLQNAIGEIEYGQAEGNFDALVVNDSVDGSVRAIVKALAAWYPSLKFDKERACPNMLCKCPDCTCGEGCTCNISPEVVCDPCKDFKKAMMAQQAAAEAQK
jgi:guanylate kinase